MYIFLQFSFWLFSSHPAQSLGPSHLERVLRQEVVEAVVLRVPAALRLLPALVRPDQHQVVALRPARQHPAPLVSRLLLALQTQQRENGS